MRRATIIVNPTARNSPSLDEVRSVSAAWHSTWEIDVQPTEAPQHATSLARLAAERGSTVVFACGGDGTVNEVVNGLVGSAASLGVIRGGMGNVFAKEVHVPRDMQEAIRVLSEGEGFRFDLGLAGERHFLTEAGVGLDARVVRKVPGGPKRLLGSTSYVLWGTAESLRFRSRAIELQIDGRPETVDFSWLLLANTRSYAGVVNVASAALADDGALDAYAFTGSGLAGVLRIARLVALHHLADPHVRFYRTANLVVLSPGMDVQVDGEYLGQTPMEFSVKPRALEILLGRGAANRLVSANS